MEQYRSHNLRHNCFELVYLGTKRYTNVSYVCMRHTCTCIMAFILNNRNFSSVPMDGRPVIIISTDRFTVIYF